MVLVTLSSACSGVPALTRAASAVARRFPADSVTASLTDDTLLTITLANSSIADLEESRRAVTANKIAALAARALRYQTTLRVVIRFTRIKRLGFMSQTKIVGYYTFAVYADTLAVKPDSSASSSGTPMNERN
jgi:hypothetical protein